MARGIPKSNCKGEDSMLGKNMEVLGSALMKRADNLAMMEMLKWWEKRKELFFC